MKKTISILGLISMVFVMSGCFYSVEAISVIPSIVKFSIIPGENKSDVFNIRNGGNEEVYVEIFMKDWVVGTDTSRKFAEPGTHSRSLCKWITFEEESFTIPPQQNKKIRYMVEVPQNAEGGYWGLVCFESKPVKKGGGGIKVATQLVSFMGIEAEGTMKRSVKITEVLAEHVKDKGVRLTAKLKNFSNTPLFQPSPLGKFKIKDKDGNIITDGELEGAMILPNEVGEYTSQYFKLKKDEYETTIFFDYGDTKLIGKKVILPTDTFFDWKKLEEVKK